MNKSIPIFFFTTILIFFLSVKSCEFSSLPIELIEKIIFISLPSEIHMLKDQNKTSSKTVLCSKKAADRVLAYLDQKINIDRTLEQWYYVNKMCWHIITNHYIEPIKKKIPQHVNASFLFAYCKEHEQIHVDNLLTIFKHTYKDSSVIPIFLKDTPSAISIRCELRPTTNEAHYALFLIYNITQSSLYNSTITKKDTFPTQEEIIKFLHPYCPILRSFINNMIKTDPQPIFSFCQRNGNHSIFTNTTQGTTYICMIDAVPLSVFYTTYKESLNKNSIFQRLFS